MRKLALVPLSLAALLLFSAFQDTQFRVDVEAVNVFVTITDKKGQFVTGLPEERFILYEDGVPQVITNFSSQMNRPLQIGLVVDTSGSVRLKLEFEKRAAINFLRGVMRRNDQAMLVEFDEGVSLLNDFTSRTSEIVEEIEKLRAGGGTALWDALYVVSGEKMTGRGARKAMVVLSDGEDLNSKRTFDDTLKMIQSSEVTVYAIGTNHFGASSSRKGEDNLKELTGESGGTAFFPYSAELLESAFDQINAELRSQYSLTYSPRDKTRDGRFRQIDVRIENGDDLKLRHRRGYRLPDF